MASMNKVILLGNLGQDPEIKHLTNGSVVANLSIATSESWKDKQTGERREKTQWHRIVIWNEGLVGVVEKFLAKGDQIMVEGQLETRSWEDQESKKHYATEVVLKGFKAELQIIKCKKWEENGGSRAGSSTNSAQRPAQGAAPAQRQDLDDEIPF